MPQRVVIVMLITAVLAVSQDGEEGHRGRKHDMYMIYIVLLYTDLTFCSLFFVSSEELWATCIVIFTKSVSTVTFCFSHFVNFQGFYCKCFYAHIETVHKNRWTPSECL